ncbi:MAG: hypothetical protein ACD_77C00029G0002 [uncultured bacterium]|nr:MAG: hypothetical protein ACD_77C00029G0002 [uncultured bacterium]
MENTSSPFARQMAECENYIIEKLNDYLPESKDKISFVGRKVKAW